MNSSDNTKLFLIGNKLDLERVVSFQTANDFAEDNSMTYFEVSAKTGVGIAEVMRVTTQKVIDSL